MRLNIIITLTLVVPFIFTIESLAQDSHPLVQKKIIPKSNNSPIKTKKTQFAPLIERYIMDELKALRKELAETRIQMISEITDRELSVAQSVSNVANNTVTFFFYVFAVLGAGFALWGWRSLNDLKSSVREASEAEIYRLSREYEQRLTRLEQEIHSKGQIILENQHEIERTQNIHAFWLQVNQTPDPRAKIEIYDKILELSPNDLEAMAYKADAALQLGDREWALSLCNRVLTDNPESSLALYQRACAYVGLGNHEAAITDLKIALELSPTLKDRAAEEEEFAELAGNAEFNSIVNGYDQQEEGSDNA